MMIITMIIRPSLAITLTKESTFGVCTMACPTRHKLAVSENQVLCIHTEDTTQHTHLMMREMRHKTWPIIY